MGMNKAVNVRTPESSAADMLWKEDAKARGDAYYDQTSARKPRAQPRALSGELAPMWCLHVAKHSCVLSGHCLVVRAGLDVGNVPTSASCNVLGCQVFWPTLSLCVFFFVPRSGSSNTRDVSVAIVTDCSTGCTPRRPRL